MLEMAAHIGAYETLLICESFGGRDVYIPADATKNPFAEIIGMDKANKLSWVYRRETIAVPTARYALGRARRAPIIAAARKRKISVTEAARILKMRRDYVSKIVNGTDEGTEALPLILLQEPTDPRQIDMFPDLNQK